MLPIILVAVKRSSRAQLDIKVCKFHKIDYNMENFLCTTIQMKKTEIKKENVIGEIFEMNKTEKLSNLNRDSTNAHSITTMYVKRHSNVITEKYSKHIMSRW